MVSNIDKHIDVITLSHKRKEIYELILFLNF